MSHLIPPHQDLCCFQIQLFSSLLLNPIALRKAKTVYKCGLSEYNRVKEKTTLVSFKSSPHLGIALLFRVISCFPLLC